MKLCSKLVPIAFLLATLISPSIAFAQRVLLLHAELSDPASPADVQTKLVGTGAFTQVDVINAATSTPSLATLLSYDAVLVWSNFAFADPTALGNVLADYVDQGGGVVLATFTFTTSVSLDGRWQTGGYLPFNEASLNFGAPLTLVRDSPSHPILAGVTTFAGGTSSYHSQPLVLQPGTTLVAHWSNGQPLVGVRNGPVQGRIVGLNMYPVSSDAKPDFWDRDTQGAQLMANALQYVNPNAANDPPVADAGPDQTREATASAGASFTLNGTGSSDPEGQSLTYSWSGPFTGSPTTGATPTVTLAPPPAPSQTITHTITLTVTDDAGNSGTDTVELTVTDLTPPVISGTPGPLTAEAESAAGAVVTYGPVVANDAVDGPLPVSCAPASASEFALGTTTASCVSVDTRDNSITTPFTVTVVDTTKPSVTVPENITAEATSAAGAAVTFSSSASDAVAGDLTPTCTSSSGNTFGFTTTRVTCSATDAHGNSASAGFTVTVQDTVAPLVSCVATPNPNASNTAAPEDPGNFFLVTSSDAVGVRSLTMGNFSVTPGETVQLTGSANQSDVIFLNTTGSQNTRHFHVPRGVVITATDAAGNVATAVCQP